ncbi:hypothetical protein [Winogradskyella aurantia]|uniref:Uncharacterized protein n=1 Tax=Winogradskyella aurantia TaxID=1915063 RepID=A0A265UQJ1_9FLAO|nr:hypothetical protein [Winogradskyella aurantia]OZV67601.1 hypothetical protein CA834_11670 [Winogradskyella aurantia]
MGISLSKLFGAKPSDASTDDSTDAIIKDVENKPFGVSEANVLYAGLNELGSYYFFQTVTVGSLNVKSKKGAQLLLKGVNFELKLDADILEFESEKSPVKGRFVTKVDFQIEEEDLQLLEKAELNSIQLNVKQHEIIFLKHYAPNDEEE